MLAVIGQDISLYALFILVILFNGAHNVLVHLTKFRICHKLSNSKFTVTPLGQLNSMSIMHCLGICRETTGCTFVNYNWSKETCSMFEKLDITSEISSTLDTTSLYYDESVSNTVCPTDWYYDPTTGLCHYLSEALVDWISAKEQCWNMGGYLTEVKSYNEWIFLKNKIIAMYDRNTWIGIRKSNDYMYSYDGRAGKSPSSLVYTNWGEGFPSYAYDCVALRKTLSYQWKDINCSRPRRFSCSMPAVMCM